MMQTRSIKELPSGFFEVDNNEPDHPYVILAQAVEAGRKIGADRVEFEEEYKGVRLRLVVPIFNS